MSPAACPVHIALAGLLGAPPGLRREEGLPLPLALSDSIGAQSWGLGGSPQVTAEPSSRLSALPLP